MKKLFFSALFFFTIIILFLILKPDYIEKTNFDGKETVKKIFFYVKKNYLKNKYSGCFIDEQNKEIDKQIVIAGHTYGSPSDKNLSTYPKFLNSLSRTSEQYDYAFLAGDIVFEANQKNFLKIKSELSPYFNNLYIAPGNHDVGLALKNKNIRKQFLSVFNKNYQKIVTNKNLFIVLDSTVDPGSISKDQMVFLRKELENIQDIKNIFIITHHAIWQNYTREKIWSNAKKGLFLNNNFKEVTSLLFENLKKEIKVFFIAGDFGVFKERTVIFCEKNRNLYFIATGMGNKRLDNYLKVLISSDGEILSIKPIFF